MRRPLSYLSLAVLILPLACAEGIGVSGDEEPTGAAGEGGAGATSAGGAGGTTAAGKAGATTAGAGGAKAGSGGSTAGSAGSTAGTAGTSSGAGGAAKGGAGGKSAGAGGATAGSTSGGSAGEPFGGGGTAGASAGMGGTTAAGAGGTAAGAGGSTAGTGGTAAGTGGTTAGTGGTTTAGTGGTAAGAGGSTAGTGGAAGSAGGPPVDGDGCPGIALSVGATPTTAKGDAKPAANDFNPPCGSGDGKDLVYALTATIDGFMSVSVDGATGVDPIIYAQAACGTGAALDCKDKTFSGGIESLGFYVTNGSTYYVTVDFYSTASSGAFDLTAKISPLPPGSACPGEPLAVTSAKVVTFSGTTVNAGSDITGTGNCVNTADDVVLAVTPDQTGSLHVDVDPGTGFDAMVYVSKTCGGAQTACAESAVSGGIEKLDVDVVANEPVYVVVDGYQTSNGAFSATFTLTPEPPNDRCATAAVIDLVAGTPSIVNGTTKAGHDDAKGEGCGGTSGPDVFYSITPSTSGNLALKLQPVTSGFDTILYVTTGMCGNPGTEVVCKDALGSTAEQATIPVTAGTTYFVAVDGYSSTEIGDFTLTASLIAAPTNDTCATAQAVALDPGQKVLSGTTTAAGADYTGSCATTGTSEDVVYAVTPSASGKLTVTLDPGTGFDSVLYAYKTTCGDSAKIIGCKDVAGSSPEVLTFDVNAGETYWVVADGYSGADGDFVMTLDLAAAPANDKCANATPVSVAMGAPVTLTGDTTSAINDSTGTCGGGATGPDVAYLVTPAATGNLKVTLKSTSSSYDPVLYAGSGACGTGPELQCRDATSSSGTEVSTIAVTGGQPYWVIADGYAGSKGPFSITFEQP